ncbi:beta-1,3-glucanase family protein [Nitrospirillum iridis]|uniref:GH64 domain-containing protein n=1 Tax=Nitrospirillum iridis TaxID=765888 RepID=A0A7X0EHN9_9PROT|nr:beta-1,3-glucanase family protein [Nitrospirillum iridis]MBB6254864.1 hypothetical protein [Nitrospirillum iridis]
MKTVTASPTGVPEAQLILDLTQTDLPEDTPVYFYVIGEVQTPGGNQYYYLDQDFIPRLMVASDNTQKAGKFPGMDNLPAKAQTALAANYPLPWADWSIKVSVWSNLILPLGNINTTTIPGLGTGTQAFSGRIYVSVGVPKLPFTVQTDKSGCTVIGYTAPVFGNGTGVGGSLTLFDWIEFSYDSEGNFNGNTTQVNQFGFPLYLSAEATSGGPLPVMGALTTSRNQILATLSTWAAPFNPGMLVPVPSAATAAYPANTSYLRALSPDELSSAGPGLASYYNTVVTSAYIAWQGSPLVLTDLASGSFTGVVFPTRGTVTIAPPPDYPAGALAFYTGSYTTMQDLATALNSDQPPALAFFLTGTANVVTSNEIWQCDGALATGDTAQKNVGKILAAAFNRGTVINNDGIVSTSMTDVDCACQASGFYANGTTFNPWASYFHMISTNGLAYAFAYDDVCDQNPSLPPPNQSLVAAWVRVALGPFNSAGISN